jgi:hypothetical protein
LVPENSYEVVVGDDSNPVFTRHTKAEFNGDGSAKVTAYRDDTKHGNISVRMKTTGTTSYAYMQSSCIPVSPATKYYTYAATKTLSGIPNVILNPVEYSDGACVNYLTASNSYSGNPTTGSWNNNTQGSFTTNAGTNSVYLVVYSWTSASDFLLDSISIKATTHFTPWVHNPGAGTTTYNDRAYSINNTLATQSYNGTYPYQNGFCSSVWIYTDFGGDEFDGNLFPMTTSGVANYWYIRLENLGYVTFALADPAGLISYRYAATDASSWTKSNWHYIEVCTSNTGTMTGHWYNVGSQSWYPLSSVINDGTRIFTGQGSFITIGTPSVNMRGAYYSHICIKPYNAIYPNCGFNGGKPPFLAATYPPLPI